MLHFEPGQKLTNPDIAFLGGLTALQTVFVAPLEFARGRKFGEYVARQKDGLAELYVCYRELETHSFPALTGGTWSRMQIDEQSGQAFVERLERVFSWIGKQTNFLLAVDCLPYISKHPD